MFLRFLPFIFLIIFSVNSMSFAQDIEKGSFTIKATSEDILGFEMASSYSPVLEPDDVISWSVHVPENYDPSNPPGIMVYVGFRKLVKEPPGWMSAMDDSNLIWISANSSNSSIERKKMLLAILSLPLLQMDYVINTNRIYVAGFQHGGEIASAAARVYPNIIKGGMYINCDPRTWGKKLPPQIDVMKENRYIFVSGKQNIAKQVMRYAIRKYNKEGINNTKQMVINHMGINENIRRSKLLEAIRYLDQVENSDD